ncbi:MAG: hypothetical protein JWO94_576 [Verrucomicrobiaceae bacterium]|nr:hypothetical protein [Verrucomicrobiaceae bacterium]
MNLLADIVIPGHHFGQVTEQAPGSEAFVLVTLVVLAFLFGSFIVAALVLWHRGRRPAPHRQLLMEMEEEEAGPPPPKPKAIGNEDKIRRHPWEQQADWWKEQ